MEESGADSPQPDTRPDAETAAGTAAATVWILVDRSAREAAFESVAELLRAEGLNAQIVTITDVIGSVARDALAGGAERVLRGLRVAFKGRGLEEDLLGAVKRARADILAVTNPRYGRALSLLESLSGINTLQVGILPDFDLSTDWINSSLQAFIVPTEEHRERLVANGLLADRVLVAAPALQKNFIADIDRDAVRKELGFGDKTVVLVRADLFSPSVVEKIVFQATLVEGAAQFIFHHNGDGACAAALRRAADQYGLPAAMFGKVADLERYVAASDLVLAAPAEPYVAEVLAQGRPLLFVGAEEGGAAQADYLSEAKAARYVVDVLRLGREIERSIEPEALQTAAEAAAKIGAKDGSQQVAQALQVALKHADDWLYAPASHDTPAGDSGADKPGRDDDEPPRTSGPFETIGAGRSRAAEDSSDAGAPGHGTAAGGAKKERTPRHRPSYSGLSAAEAKDQLAELILMERDLERRLAEVAKQQTRWQNRLQLAREWNETDLADEARDILTGFNADADALSEELDDVRRQKTKLKRAAGGSADNNGERPGGTRGLLIDEGDADRVDPREVEARFRKMELDRDLDDLKDKINRDFGE